MVVRRLGDGVHKLGAVRVVTTIMWETATLVSRGTVNSTGPVTDRAHGVLEPHVEGESPLAITERVAVHLFLTGGTFPETGLSCWTTLPESAAVWNIISQKNTQSNNLTYCWSARGSRVA